VNGASMNGSSPSPAGASVVIDCFPGTVSKYSDDHRIVVVDVIRATTLAVTGSATGRRCIVAADPDDAVAIRDRLGGGILAGELGGDLPEGFDMNNSPAELELRTDIEVPLIMVSTSGGPLMIEAGAVAGGADVACFRNFTAVARSLIGNHRKVAIIGAGSRGEFREEDQMCCAWIGGLLMGAGYLPETDETRQLIERWRGAPAAACEISNSVGYLRRSGQLHDFDFIVSHVDDLDAACSVEGNEVVAESPAPRASTAAVG
jgi:2-phosphosulfolactate phosphatase